MKKSILIVLLLIFLVACKKDGSVPPNSNLKATLSSTVGVDTIPDGAVLKIKLCKDSIQTDETCICFDHKHKPTYIPTEDAKYLMGFGSVHLSSLSADKVSLAINGVPYQNNMSINLDSQANTDGIYSMQISHINNIPAYVQIFLKDNYLKDSIEIRTKIYKFNVRLADTSSYGKRFKLIFKNQ